MGALVVVVIILGIAGEMILNKRKPTLNFISFICFICGEVGIFAPKF